MGCLWDNGTAEKDGTIIQIANFISTRTWYNLKNYD